jgi:hypothetical protein
MALKGLIDRPLMYNACCNLQQALHIKHLWVSVLGAIVFHHEKQPVRHVLMPVRQLYYNI